MQQIKCNKVSFTEAIEDLFRSPLPSLGFVLFLSIWGTHMKEDHVDLWMNSFIKNIYIKLKSYNEFLPRQSRLKGLKPVKPRINVTSSPSRSPSIQIWAQNCQSGLEGTDQLPLLNEAKTSEATKLQKWFLFWEPSELKWWLKLGLFLPCHHWGAWASLGSYITQPTET